MLDASITLIVVRNDPITWHHGVFDVVWGDKCGGVFSLIPRLEDHFKQYNCGENTPLCGFV